MGELRQEFDWAAYAVPSVIECNECGAEMKPDEVEILRKAFHHENEQMLLEYFKCTGCDSVYVIGVETFDTLRTLQTLQEARSAMQAAIKRGKSEKKVKRLHRVSKRAFKARSIAYRELQDKFKDWMANVRTVADVDALI